MSDWHGFLPNTWDTKIMSSYVDENFSNGLKQNSKAILGYDQTEYKDVMRVRVLKGQKPYKGGRVVSTEKVYPQVEKLVKGVPTMVDDTKAEPTLWLTIEYRMNEVPAERVLAYGADDTICTAALYVHYHTIMELEDTVHLYEEVEQKPSYLTAQAFIQGCKFNIPHLRKLEKEDDEAFDKAKTVFGTVLNNAGLLDKMWEPYTDNRCADFKDAFLRLFDHKIESNVRTHKKLAQDILNDGVIDTDTQAVRHFIKAVEEQNIEYCNLLLKEKFKKDALIDMNSPKQMKKFLYEVLGLPVRVINDPTDLERKNDPDMADTLRRFKKLAMKGETAEWTEEEKGHLKSKAKTDDVAVGMALLYDCGDRPEVRQVLEAMQTMKTIITRRSLYYSKYPWQPHWKDGMVHAAINQCAAATRRYSSSGPNLQQQPKKGEGVKIRETVEPHHEEAVIVSLDYNGQELRLAAEMSQDANMLACYIGEKKKDIHSITASGAMIQKWGKDKLAELAAKYNQKVPETVDELYDFFVLIHKGTKEDDPVHKMADDLRKNAKNVNFGDQYDAQALTLAYTLLIPVKDAQDFLDARAVMFPGLPVWKDNVRDFVMSNGYARTLMGGRRHLSKLMFNNATANKAGRQGPNFAIQGSAAEQTKLGMARVWDSGVTYKYDCRFIAPIHDELVFSIHRDHVIEAIRLIHAAMTGPYGGMTVPIVSSISLGPNFGVQIEVGETVDEDRINAALAKIFQEERMAA